LTPKHLNCKKILTKYFVFVIFLFILVKQLLMDEKNLCC
jgi:hypothetical protein